MREWEHIKLDRHSSYKSWSIDAVHCFETVICCEICPISKNLDRSFWNGGCKMPFAVQELLDKRIPRGRTSGTPATLGGMRAELTKRERKEKG